jgi:hypothetical protein
LPATRAFRNEVPVSRLSPANAELSIVLPLGVVANQLSKVEGDLRFIVVKTSSHSGEHWARDKAGQVAAHLEKINETLELIRGLVQDLETEFQTGSAGPSKKRADRDD